ncbi:MAG: class I SAM-dependent methyltransferase [Rhodocyclaceae bacterium]|nr:class I SAM-dependent methyltransferase [Rhodocyclaceae bacterium]
MLNALVFLPADLDQSVDMSYGWSILRHSIPAHRWITVEAKTPADWFAENEALIGSLQGPTIVILHPFLTVCRNLVAELNGVLALTNASCVSPADLRGVGLSERTLHYATLRGLERDAEGFRRDGQQAFAYDGRTPHLALFREGALAHFLREHHPWSGQLPADSLIVPSALVHDHSGYYTGARPEVLALLPEQICRFLDVGGGEGYFAASVKKLRTCETHVAEINNAVAKKAAGRVDMVWVGDIFDQREMPSFDFITALDMLEHVDNPDALLDHFSSLLLPDGRILISLPNLGHWSVVCDLLEGFWDYIAVGISCRTHQRFFSRSTICDLFSRSGWVIERLEETRHLAPPGWIDELQRLGTQLNLAVDRNSLETYAFLVLAHRP